MDENVVVG